MSSTLDYSVRLDAISRGFDGESFWSHARAGALPGDEPTVVVTMQKTLRSGSDIFFAISEIRSDDFGETWTGPVEHADSLSRRKEPNGVEVCTCDFTPAWHAAAGVLLGTGHTARYQGEALLGDPRPRETRSKRS